MYLYWLFLSKYFSTKVVIKSPRKETIKIMLIYNYYLLL